MPQPLRPRSRRCCKAAPEPRSRPPRARARSAETRARALELVGERLELRRLAAASVRERLREQPVGEPRVARQQRPVEVRADRAAEPAALEAALAVVAEAGDDAAERLRTGVELRPAGVVLEARERPARARLELGLEQHVADHPPLAGDRLERQQADARHVLAVEAAIAAPEQLVAAADREERRAALERPPPSAAPPSRRGSRRRGAARGPGRRRRSRGRARPGRSRRPCPSGVTSSSCPRQAARRAKTAMLPRSA